MTGYTKRGIVLILVLTTVFTCNLAGAIEISPVANGSLFSYCVSMKSGNSAGTAKISFSMKPTQLADCVGVSAIKTYTLDGDYVTTIKGTTGNGLLAQNCRIHSGSYTYYGQSGISYYAVVTAYADDSGPKAESKDVTTQLVEVL